MAADHNLIKRTVVLVGTETTKGTLAGSLTALRVNEGASMAKEATRTERNLLDGQFGSYGNVPTSRTWTTSVQCEVTGSEASPLPPYASLMESASCKIEDCYVLTYAGLTGDAPILGETLTDNATTDVVGQVLDIDTANSKIYLYNMGVAVPVDAMVIDGENTNSFTISGAPEASKVFYQTSLDAESKTNSVVYHEDGEKKTAVYCVSNATVDLAIDAIPVINFDIQGVYGAPLDEANPVVTFDTSVPEPLVSALLKISGVDQTGFTIESFNLDFGNEIVQAKDLQASDALESFHIVDAMPKLTMTISRPVKSNWNVWTDDDNQVERALAIEFGSDVNQRFRVGVPYGQLEGTDSTDNNGLTYMDLSFNANKKVGGLPNFWMLHY